MGVMKKVNIAHTLKMWPLSLEERSSMRAIIACDERRRVFKLEEAQRNRLRYSEEDMIESIYIRHEYVGNRPSMEGLYQVFDTGTSSTTAVTVGSSNNSLIVWSIGEIYPVKLDSFNLPSFRWFRVSRLFDEDKRAIRSLPLTLRTNR